MVHRHWYRAPPRKGVKKKKKKPTKVTAKAAKNASRNETVDDPSRVSRVHGLKRMCKDPVVVEKIQDCVRTTSEFVCINSLFHSFYIETCIQDWKRDRTPIPLIDRNFFNRSLSGIANQLDRNAVPVNDVRMQAALVSFRELYPEYHGRTRVGGSYLSQILNEYAQKMFVNFIVSLQVNFIPRLKQWLKLRIRIHIQDYGSTWYTSPVLSSILSLLSRACTERDATIASLLPLYSVRFGRNRIPDEEMDFLNKLIEEVRDHIGHEGIDYVHGAHKLITCLDMFMVTRQSYIKIPKAFRMFQVPTAFTIFPQQRLRAKCIDITTTILKLIHKENISTLKDRDDPMVKKPKFPDKAKWLQEFTDEELWYFYFNIDYTSNGRNDGKEFANHMTTDGVSVSLLYKPKKDAASCVKDRVEVNDQRTDENDEQYYYRKLTEHYKAELEDGRYDGLISIDTGLNPFLTCFYTKLLPGSRLRHHYTFQDLVPPGKPYDVKQVSTDYWYSTAGYDDTYRLAMNYTRSNPFIVGFNASVKSTKTSSMVKLKSHIVHVLTNVTRVLDFYHEKKWKNLKRKAYIKKQKAYHVLGELIRCPFKHPLIILGDGCTTSNMRGCRSLPTTKFVSRMMEMFNVVLFNEDCTSKRCSECNYEMQGMLQENRVYRSWKMRVCNNVLCNRRFHDRNINASINIAHLFLLQATGQGRPAVFIRGTASRRPAPVTHPPDKKTAAATSETEPPPVDEVIVEDVVDEQEDNSVLLDRNVDIWN